MGTRWFVDGNNVLGSRPDGWWHDRTGAQIRIHDEIVRWRDHIGEPVTLVLDGRPNPRLPEGARYGVDVRFAGRAGPDGADDRIVELVAEDEGEDDATVVTADAALRDRVEALGARVEGPRRFLDRLADIPARRSDRAVLAHFGIDETALVGRGGEARVFAVDHERVVRLPHLEHDGAARASLKERRRFLDALGTVDGLPVPQVLEHREVEGRLVVIERRLPGRNAIDVLSERGTDREALVRDHLDVVSRVADLDWSGRHFGEAWGADDDRADDFASWSQTRLGANLARGGDRFAAIDPATVTSAVVAALGSSSPPVLVHLDAFLGNLLADRNRITAVLDFGPMTIGGLRGLDPLVCVAYLDEHITPRAIERDRVVARQWAAEHGWGDAVEPVRRWIAAYWAGAPEDERLREWCTEILCPDLRPPEPPQPALRAGRRQP